MTTPEVHTKVPGSVSVQKPVVSVNGTADNSTGSGGGKKEGLGPDGSIVDSQMIQRALYVLVGSTLIGLLYFLIRAVRLKKPSLKKKKYGLLQNYDDSVEMEGVESEEEDNTLYEARALRR